MSNQRIMSGVRAFTLIELLVVVAIIALLVSILLPSLSAAREQGKAIKCGANLKDIGLSMTQYVMEHRHYPGLHSRNDVNRLGAYQIWFVRLRPYFGEQHGIFSCPSQRPEFNWTPTYDDRTSRGFRYKEEYGYRGTEVPVIGTHTPPARAFSEPHVYGFAYGYNDRGSGARLGLGSNIDVPATRERPENEVKMPAKMVVITDSKGDFEWDAAVDPTSAEDNEIPDFRHNKSAEVLFADGHVDNMKRTQLLPQTRQDVHIMRMWNYDFLPHYDDGGGGGNDWQEFVSRAAADEE